MQTDGQVVITRGYRYYTISVPKSKKLGAQYYENDRLLNLIDDGNFYPHRGQLQGDVPVEDIEKAVNVLSDLGVQMKSDTQVQFDTETEMGQAQASGRRFDEDIEESIEDVVKNYNSVSPVHVIRTTDTFTDDELRELMGNDMPDYAIPLVRDYIRNYKTEGLYNPLSNKIIIFADNIGKRDVSAREAYFHENLHAALHKRYGDGLRDICRRFWNNSTTPVAEENKKAILNGRSQEEAEEEYFVRITAQKMNKNSVSNIFERLNESDRAMLYDIFKTIGYEERRDEAREGQGMVRENEEENHSLLQGRNQGRVSDHQGRIANHIDKLVKKLGTKARTTVYRSLEEVPEDVRKHIEQRHRQGKKVRGWYENGQVYLFLPDIESEYQAEKTIWHETVAHHGLRELIGVENYDKLLRQLWLEHRDGDMGKWVTEGEALEKAKERLEEYTQKMKEEMEAKEAKYKEMDSEVEAAGNISLDEEDDDGTPATDRRYDEDIEESVESIINELQEKYNTLVPIRVYSISNISDDEIRSL